MDGGLELDEIVTGFLDVGCGCSGGRKGTLVK